MWPFDRDGVKVVKQRRGNAGDRGVHGAIGEAGALGTHTYVEAPDPAPASVDEGQDEDPRDADFMVL